MARGMIAGIFAGVVVSGLGLSTAAVMVPPPGRGPVLPVPGQGAKPVARPEVASRAGPAEGVPLPAGSEFARTDGEQLPAATSDIPAPDSPENPPKAPPSEAMTGAEIAALDDPVTAPPARPQPDIAPPVAPVAPQTPEAALESAPSAEPSMPVPPPGEAVAPDLPPAEVIPEPGQEITLMPDGALVPVSPALPRMLNPGEGSGFADAEGTKVNRLPQVGADPQAAPATATAEPQEDETVTAASAPAALPAIERFAASYTAKPDQPWFSVMLLDQGAAVGGLDRETIKALGSWVTVVIDPAAPDAAQAARDYRAAGMEVAILADPLPDGAEPKDVEIALAGWRAAVPEALALVEPERPVLQGQSRLAEQAQKALAAGGMAYVTQSVGMGARTEGGLQATIWRVLDARRDKATVIARTLSRAAFEAKRDGSVVVMLSAWPESVAGLQEWRAEAENGLNLAPLSATVQAMARP
ncbi:hypothetical protein SAMN05877809_106179 [Rhodobacter sp. JA431]|uniref:divergent polysaccharide deacetylase family protein n=1 Tax=Rhodobacter sp. JA431 TaxID=570013 RepID=UPI000BD754D5|nr:divergent polysaccharide deacetylase family protein [Rhodobacter sp. JA431]SOC12987.1 hypothetical protein SAMN05877809_106179 [Rhodobacter sp. JA431]